jgi:hypothetical protein
VNEKSRIILIALIAVFAGLAIRQYLFVDRYAVDVFYWDSWDLYHPLFAGGSWWDCFDFQHGPHRQGLGGLLMRVLAPRSHWNARWDAFSVSFALIACAPLAVWLAIQCGVRGWSLLFVPFICLNIRQCHMFIASANPSHGALPILLFIVYCLVCFIRGPLPRWIALSVLTFLLLFTGFGLFVGVITPVLLVVELIQLIRNQNPRRNYRIGLVIAALLINGGSWALFARGYHFDPAAPGFRFPYEHPIEYLYFIGAMFSNFFGFGYPTMFSVAVGLITFASLTAICVIHGWLMISRGLDENPRSVVIFCLSAYSLIYSIDAAIGRTFLGWQTGALSRYVTLMIPMALAMLFHLSTTSALHKRRLAIIYGCLLVIGTFTLHQTDQDAVDYLHNSCLNWRTAYLQTHDQAAADRLAHFAIYPRNLTNRLHYLQVLKLNLFDPSVFPPDSPG